MNTTQMNKLGGILSSNMDCCNCFALIPCTYSVYHPNNPDSPHCTSSECVLLAQYCARIKPFPTDGGTGSKAAVWVVYQPLHTGLSY